MTTQPTHRNTIDVKKIQRGQAEKNRSTDLSSHKSGKQAVTTERKTLPVTEAVQQALLRTG